MDDDNLVDQAPRGVGFLNPLGAATRVLGAMRTFRNARNAAVAPGAGGVPEDVGENEEDGDYEHNDEALPSGPSVQPHIRRRNEEGRRSGGGGGGGGSGQPKSRRERFGGNGKLADMMDALDYQNEFETASKKLIRLLNTDGAKCVMRFVNLIETGHPKEGTRVADWGLLMGGAAGRLATSDPWSFIQTFCPQVAVAAEEAWLKLLRFSDLRPNLERNEVLNHEVGWRLWANMALLAVTDLHLLSSQRYDRMVGRHQGWTLVAQEVGVMQNLYAIGWRSSPTYTTVGGAGVTNKSTIGSWYTGTPIPTKTEFMVRNYAFPR